jgi:hypothetical protein
LVKKVAMYGTNIIYEHVRQRYWKWIYHRKGPEAGTRWYKRRVWKTTKALRRVEGKGRYEFSGTGKELYRAIMTGHHYMPRGYVDVEAREFTEHPGDYGDEGYWIEKRIESK